MKRTPVERLLPVIVAVLVLLFGWHGIATCAPIEDDEDEEIAVFMKDILFTGNSVISTETLRGVVEEFKEKELTLEDMNTVSELVTMAYQERGYILARAYLPEQEIKNGYLIVAVVEGHIEDVVVEGNTYYDARLLKRYFKEQIDHGVVTEKMLEKELLLANELSSAETALVLKKGQKPGTVDLGLKTKDDVPFKLGIDYNNFGTEVVSTHRYGVSAAMTDPWLGTTLSVRGVTGDDFDRSSMVSGDLSIPVNSIGTRFTLSFMDGKYATGGEIAADEFQGRTKIHGAKLSHPFIKSRDTTLSFSLGWDHKYAEYESESDGGIYAVDEVDEFSARIDFDNLDRYLGKNLISVSAYHGILSDRNEPSYRRIRDVPNSVDISQASMEYDRFTASLARIQKVYGYTNFMLRASGQFTEGNYLTPLSWYSVGGYGTVRGWKPASQVTGDSGYNMTAELMFAPPYIAEKVYWGQRLAQMVQFAAFYDHGGVFVREPLENILGGGKTEQAENERDFLSGYGAGIRLFYKDKFRFKLDVGFPLGETTGDVDDYVFYLLGSYNFF